MMSRIDVELGIGLRDVSDPLAIRGPCWGFVFARVGCDLRQVRAFVGIVGSYDPDVAIWHAVWIRGGTVAAKSDLLSIGRPCWAFVIKVTGGDLCQRFAGNVDDI